MGNREEQVRAIAGSIGQFLRHLREYGHSEDVILEGLARANFNPPPPPTEAELRAIYTQMRMISMEPEGRA